MEYTIKSIGTIAGYEHFNIVAEFPCLFECSNVHVKFRNESIIFRNNKHPKLLLYCSKSNNIIFKSSEKCEIIKDCIYDMKDNSSPNNCKLRITKYRIIDGIVRYNIKPIKFVELNISMTDIKIIDCCGQKIIHNGKKKNNYIIPSKIYVWDPEEMEVKPLPYFGMVESYNNDSISPLIVITLYTDSKFIIYDIPQDKEIFQIPFRDIRSISDNNGRKVFDSLSIINKHIFHSYESYVTNSDLIVRENDVYKILGQNEAIDEPYLTDQTDIPEEEQCVICNKRRTEEMIPSCGHMHYCEACLNKLDKCSTCQQEFSIIKLVK